MYFYHIGAGFVKPVVEGGWSGRRSGALKESDATGWSPYGPTTSVMNEYVRSVASRATPRGKRVKPWQAPG